MELINIFQMALGTFNIFHSLLFILGYPNDSDPMHDDTRLGRLSLAHEKLTYMPKIICDDFGQSVKILDVCDNNIT